MGFDIVHFNLHKTFTQPHGGGGPGAGPIAVSDRIEPYLPRPQVVRREARATAPRPCFDLDYDRPKSIGRLRGFQGNYGVFVRSYAYIRSLGADGPARDVGDRRAQRELPAGAAEGGGRGRVPAGRLRPLCMHEFVLSGAPMKRELEDQDARHRQAAARLRLSPADRLLPAARRRGAPDRADRDRDEGDARRLRRRDRRDPARGRDDPRSPSNAPYTTPVRRLDEAARGEAAGHPPAAVANVASHGGCSSVDGRDRQGWSRPPRMVRPSGTWPR